MKRIISLLMALVILFSITATAFATNTDETYYTVPVEYSDNIGHHEGLRVMVQNDAVYVHAQMFAERLGYTFGETSDGLVIYNKDKTNGLPFGITQFKYNSTQVSHMLFNAMVDTYEAPFAPVKNSEGSWIPLEYAALLLNSSVMIGKDALLIDMPTKKIIDYFLDIAKNSGKYNFDWADDFGYTEADIKVLGASSHLVNIFSGLLEFDGPSWATLFQQFVGSTTFYDKKYSEDIAILICTESDDELEAATEDIELMCDLLDVDSDLGKLLSFTDEILDFEVGTLQRQCEAALEGIKAGNSTAVSYNRAYQALEAAVDRQTSFLYTGGEILEVQKKMADATGNLFSVLDWCTKLTEIGGYALEFYNQDKFSLGALQYYLATAGSGLELPNAMKSSMVSYCNALSGTLKGYGWKRFWDNLDEWVTDAVTDKVSLHSIVGSQAAAALIAWNIASNTIPFLKDGLSGADNFELAIYSMVFQADTYLNYLSRRDAVFAEDMTQENLYHLAQYCYLYLKSCYITREAALASLASKSSSTKEKIQPLVDYQNSINAEIARMLVKLKQATETTAENQQNSVFGFLPSNNKKYLDEYDGSKLLQWVAAIDLVTDAYANDWSLNECGLLFLTEKPSSNRPGLFTFKEYTMNGYVYQGEHGYGIETVYPSSLGIIASFYGDFSHSGNTTTLTVRRDFDDSVGWDGLWLKFDAPHRKMNIGINAISIYSDRETYYYIIDGETTAYLVCESVEYDNVSMRGDFYYYKTALDTDREITETITIINLTDYSKHIFTVEYNEGLTLFKFSEEIDYWSDSDVTNNLYYGGYINEGKYTDVSQAVEYIQKELGKYGLADRVFSKKSMLKNYTPVLTTVVSGVPKTVNKSTMEDTELQGKVLIGIPTYNGAWDADGIVH